MFHKEILGNKTRLITVPISGTAAMTILVMYPVGSRYEPAELNGASHFIEHLMFKGTTLRPRPIDISRALDSLGAEYNAFTGKDCTGYYIKASGEKLAGAAELLYDMLHNSLFALEELEREKSVVIEEINMYKDNPSAMVEEYFEELMFPRLHPLGKYVGGTESVIRKMTREKVIAYRDRFYVPQNAVVVIAGNIQKRALKEVKKMFAASPAKKFQKTGYKICSIPRGRPAKERLVIKWKETDQAHLALGFPGLKLGDKNNPALTILNTVAGGFMSSRLFDVVREQKGLAYMIHSGVSPYQDVGTFVVQAGLNKARVGEAIKTIKDELARFAFELISNDELTRAKDYVIGKTILQTEESSFWAGWYGRQEVLLEKRESPEEKIKKLKAVTAADMRCLAARLFDFFSMRIVLVGPYKERAPFLKFL